MLTTTTNVTKSLQDSEKKSRFFTIDVKNNLYLNVNVDTEYVAGDLDLLTSNVKNYQLVSAQIRNVNSEKPYLYKSKEIASHIEKNNLNTSKYHTTFTEKTLFIQYLKTCGVDCSIRIDNTLSKSKRDKMKRLTVTLNAHFALVDIPNCFQDVFFDDVVNWFKNKKLKHTKRTFLQCNEKQKGFYLSDHVITIDNEEYLIKYVIIDTCAMLGNKSYYDLAKLVGLKLLYKKLAGDNIRNMFNWYIDNPVDFEKYACGDLYVSDMYNNANNLLKNVYIQCDLEKYTTDIKLTIGSTVKNLIESAICKHLNIDNYSTENPIIATSNKATAKYLLQSDPRSHIDLLGKCHGGRCYNNRPKFCTIQQLIAVLYDVDISGAYGTAMTKLRYCFGNPVLASVKKGKGSSKFYMNFKLFDKHILKHCVDNCWQAVIDIKNLKFDQDIIASWYDYKTDDEGNLDAKSGKIAIFRKFVENGILTIDVLNLIKLLPSKQRNDLLNNLRVISVAFYPKNLQLDTETHVEQKYKKQTFELNKNIKNWVVDYAEDHNWSSATMGELLIDDLLLNRRKYSKLIPDEKIYNELYKLLANTVYGVSVSKYFDTTNVIFANNLTAMVRVAIWMVEKALNMFGSITDGCVANLLKVFFHYDDDVKNRYFCDYANIYKYSKRELSDRKIGYLKPLSNDIEQLIAECDNELTRPNAYEKIAKLLKKHITKQFPHPLWTNTYDMKIDEHPLWTNTYDMKIDEHCYKSKTGLFDLEIKTHSKHFTTSGVSNYTFNPDDKEQIKFRSAKKNAEHIAYELDENDNIINTPYYNDVFPQQVLLQSIAKNPKQCIFPPVASCKYILKPSEYTHLKKLRDSNLIPSDNYIKIILPRYSAINRFHFKDIEHKKIWQRYETLLINKFGYSFELFFINDDNRTFDYQLMIETLDNYVSAGYINPKQLFNPNKIKTRYLPQIVKNNKYIKDNLSEKLNNIIQPDINNCFDDDMNIDYFDRHEINMFD